MKCPRCGHENPASNFCGKCGTPLPLLEGTTQPTRSYADLQRSLTEALEQQTATAEILRVISSSPTDLQPVLDAVATNAARVCEANDASVYRVDGECLRLLASYASLPTAAREIGFTLPITRGSTTGRAVLDRQIVHVQDLQSVPDDEFPESKVLAKRFGYHTTVTAPLLREGVAIGAVVIRRTEVRPFTEKQIELLQTFADQAVIAVENVRLFNETREALERQTATSEILRVISSSPTDVQPVFDTIARNAVRVCDSTDALVVLVDGDETVTRAHYGDQVFVGSNRRPITRGLVVGRAVLEGRPIQVDDLTTAADFPDGRELALRMGHRTVMAVPLLRDGIAIGAILMRRSEVKPFTDKQIELLQTFADQAVIAIENVRLFKELEARNTDLSEALDKQTATSEILRAISSSPTDEQAVFDAIVRSAVRLCHAAIAGVFRTDGKLVYHPANYGGTPEALAEIRARYPRPLDMTTTPGIAILTRSIVHVPDIEDPSAVDFVRQAGRIIGFRAVATVPMFRKSEVVGAIVVGRREPGRFSDAEVEILKTFADQAVIAIENVWLFTELQEKNRALTAAHAQVSEALDQQTATSEILKVISSSPTDVQPVFDTIVASAARLCDADFSAVARFDGELLHLVAVNNMSPAETAAYQTLFPRAPGRHFAFGRAFVDGRPVHIEDIEADPDYDPRTREVLQRAAVYRTALGVPILQAGIPIGVIGCVRHEMKPFTPLQLELVRTFADQAVIAIENVRLFTELQASNRELRTALDTQTATSDILSVISRSQTDVQPVFDAILGSAVRLLRAYTGLLTRIVGDQLVLAAVTSTDEAANAVFRSSYPRPLHSEGGNPQAIRDRAPLNVADAFTDPRLSSFGHTYARDLGYQSLIVVPLLHRDEVLGTIAATRREPGGFTDDEIALLQTFADQAVIAIENVRLFTELQEKNRALTQAHAQVTESLEQQTATSEILRVISGSQTNIQPVFDTIAEHAMRLCSALTGLVTRFDGELIHLVALANVSPAGEDALRRRFPTPPGRHTAASRAILTGAVVHLPDVQNDPDYEGPFRAAGYRSLVSVPMLRDEEVIGTLNVHGAEVGQFSERQIRLLQTFADQAVIAIENVRLFKELQARTAELTRSVDELTALGEVSRAVSSTLDLDAVLATIVSRAVDLSGSDQGIVYEFDEHSQIFHARATHRITTEHLETVRAAPIRLGEGAIGRAGVIRDSVQVADVQDTSQPVAPQVRELLAREGMRSLLAVPLVRDQRLLGGLVILRREQGAFSPEVVATLQTFATQSVLAIQNARLFRELEAKSRELEVASQHKSEFLANMSHELRTPLNAVIGFSEVLTERMFGELNEKQDEYLKDIHASGQHLLSLINDILDLSKIEAGRMELEVTDFDLPMAIDNAMTLIRERAARRSIALHTTVDERVGQIQADERKIRQVLLNLLSNAIKFTPEGGRIEVGAKPVDGSIEVSVSDTGVGIASEDQEAVFEEFRQVGTADKKVEGTGLGLALSRKFIELHGGKIWVKSQVGEGSTFTFTVPVRRGE